MSTMAGEPPAGLSLTHRYENGMRLGTLLWRFGPGRRMISSAVLGGGIGRREWVVNAQVQPDYARLDPAEHLAEMSPRGPGVGMLTAAMVERYTWAVDEGVQAVATVGLGIPTWAAAAPDPSDRVWDGTAPPTEVTGAVSGGRQTGLTDQGRPTASPTEVTGAVSEVARPGTINIIVAVPVAFCDAALVNAVMTVTEAKTQALLEAGFACTGTASDAVCVAVATEGPEEQFGGPRSPWGARIARAVHRAVFDGAREWRHRQPAAQQDGFVEAAAGRGVGDRESRAGSRLVPVTRQEGRTICAE